MSFKRIGIVAGASVAAVSVWAACGGGNANRPAEPTPAVSTDLSFEAVTVKRTDTEAPESPSPVGSEISQAVLHALNAKHAAIAHCYDEVLRTVPEAVGRISVEIALTASGTVERVTGTTEGEGGIGNARVCIEDALRSIHVEGVPSTGVHVRRSYSFVNPAIEITVGTPLAIASRRIVAPRPRPGTTAGTAARTDAGAAGDASAETASGDAAAPAGPAVLTEADLVTALTEHQGELNACYATLLRTARTAAGTATLNFTVGPDGVVPEAALANAEGPLAGVGECIATAARGIHFRSSGTAVTAHYPLTFAR